jgi:CRISPR/Cas system CSM-associated protein Csm3 (group 7 of RAMP superfamily)
MTLQPQQLDVEFIIEWHTPWHVGSGLGSATVDRQLRRRSCGRRTERSPFVPGSHIKGVLRHRCEELAAAFGDSNIVSPHLTEERPSRALLDQFRPLAECTSLVERLFGNRFQGECLFVEDAIPMAPAAVRATVQSRTAIDRATGTARHATLFSTEVAAPDGYKLQARLAGRHPPGVLTQAQDDDGFPYEYALLLASLLSIDRLGADKSAGLGRCTVSIPSDTVHWNQAAYPLLQALKSLNDLEWLGMLDLLRQEWKS